MTLTVSDMSSNCMREPGGNRDGKAGPRDGQATRRVFGPVYKLAIVAEYDALTAHGSRGALLRREGLYQSHVDKWRRARDRGTLGTEGATQASGPVKTKDAPAGENRRLAAENARLTAELAKSRSVVAVMGKLHALLETLSESADSVSRPTP